MAEGDTIARAKLRMKGVLLSLELTNVWVGSRFRGHKPRIGTIATEIQTAGKHLLINFQKNSESEPFLAVHIHLGMDGYVRVQHGTDGGPRSSRADLVLKTTTGTVSVHKTNICRGVTPAQALEILDSVGPDLIELAGSFTGPPERDLSAAIAQRILPRARHSRVNPDSFIHELLMDQQIAAGIGNIYKSEVLFINRVSPFARLSDLTDDQITKLYVSAAELLSQNSEHGTQRRKTVGRQRRGPNSRADRERFFVYDRYHMGCRSCDAAIERSYQESGAARNHGKYQARSTYWCPSCQDNPV